MSEQHKKTMLKQYWLPAIRYYLLLITGLNFVWEILQLPLYTIWQSGTVRTILIAIFHCTVGDVLIAVTCLMISLILIGATDRPLRRQHLVAALSVFIGIVYTIFSERNNLESGAWAYSDLMPIIPGLNIGLSPILQWLAIPALSFWLVGKRNRSVSSQN